MNPKTTRRQFLAALGGAAAFAVNPFSAYAEPDRTQALRKVDALPGKPVLTIAHCCDPQFGFGPEDESYAADVAKLEKELELVNAAKPDVLFFAGDMCNDHKELKKEWPNLLKGIDAPVITAPGNHDIPDPLKKEDVDVFCEVFGAEYDAKVVNGWKIIAINSQYCRDTDETELYEKQVDWFKRELTDAKKKGQPVILGSHVPPFIKSLDEKDEYFNFPAKIRQTYLDYALSCGVKCYLAGHTHTTLEREYRGVPILNGETTSRNFDKRPFGFRLLKIDADFNYEWSFVGLE